jgi:osmotically-inducible protein OsmY
MPVAHLFQNGPDRGSRTESGGCQVKLVLAGIACVAFAAACDHPESKTETTSATTTVATQRAPDNTGVNDRDRGDSATPTTQGNDSSEVKITGEIRRSIMADDALGFDAKNVKIITTGTKVTLRGPVANQQEKSSIDAYAKKTAGVTEVDDQLEIKK